MIRKIASAFSVSAALLVFVLLAPSFNFSIGDAVKPISLEVSAKNLELICPGAAYRTGGISGTNVGSFDQVGTSSVIGTSGGSLITESRVTTAPIAALAEASGTGSELLNANQLQLIASPRMNGLAAAACQKPGNDQWLVGGDTTTGREALLILANMGAVDSTVNLNVFSEAGEVKAPGLTGISVANNSTLIVPLASLIPKTKTFVMHVTSNGGAIAAYIQQKTVRGLSAQGADLISPTTVFGNQLKIAGILVRGAKDAETLQANIDYQDLTPVLRVFVAGDKAATVTGQIFGTNAKTFGTVVRETVAAHSVKDIALTGLADGDYAAFVDSDQPITAAIRLVRTKAKSTDFTWLQAGEDFTVQRTVTVPATGITKLSIVNGAAKSAKVKVNGQLLEIAAASAVVIKVEPASKVTISSDQPVSANLVVDVNSTVANIPVLDYRNTGANVSVRVR